jgi:hypothetical protein
MTDPIIPIGEAAKVAEALVKPVYEDLVQPTAKELGSVLGRTVRAALSPIRALVWGAEEIEGYLHSAVTKRLSGIPPEQVQNPDPAVGGPLITALRFVGEKPNLREMYANLLATAMDRKTAEQAHPAFVEILKQLTPDEAKILAYIPTNLKRPVITIDSINADERSRRTVLRHFSAIGWLAGCEHLHLAPSYLENLCRLGLTIIPGDARYSESELYQALEGSPEVLKVKAQIESEGRQMNVTWQVLAVTNFGTQFIDSCVLEHRVD